MAKLLLNDKEYSFDTYITIGRSSKTDMRIPDIKLSRYHCEIIKDDDDYIIIDLHSQNGTKVNDHFITETTLNDKDKILIGRTEILFKNNSTKI